MTNLKTGVLLWTQGATMQEQLTGAREVERLGYDSLWTWDHIHAIFGDPHQPIFEGWTLLSAWAMATERVQLGLLVGANTFRNPGLTAKLASTVDHVSNGRTVLGIGGAWFEFEHSAYGIDFGTGFGQRLDWLDEAVAACRVILDGGTVTSAPGAHYKFHELRQLPVPIQAHMPILIGGTGEKKTLRTIAKYADMWNAMGTLELLRHKVEVLRQHCDEVGRDISEIEFTLGAKPTIRDSQAEAERAWKASMERNKTPFERVADDVTFWNGTPEQIAERLAPYVELGFHNLLVEMPAPWDQETLERLIGEVKPLIERG